MEYRCRILKALFETVQQQFLMLQQLAEFWPLGQDHKYLAIQVKKKKSNIANFQQNL